MDDNTPVVPDPVVPNQRQEFYDALINQFRLIRPFYTKIEPDPEDPIYQKLMIIDRTVTNSEAFEAGYSIWLENHDVVAFLESFLKKDDDAQPADTQ